MDKLDLAVTSEDFRDCKAPGKAQDVVMTLLECPLPTYIRHRFTTSQYNAEIFQAKLWLRRGHL